MKMIKDNLAGQELRISSDAIDIVVDCCSGKSLLPRCMFVRKHNDISYVTLSSFLGMRNGQLACCTEFVKMLYTEANDVCTNEKKNTIVPDHVLKAVEQLDLQDWMEPLQKALVEYKDQNKPVKATKANANMNDEELVRSYPPKI